jgi:hypothetical protein
MTKKACIIGGLVLGLAIGVGVIKQALFTTSNRAGSANEHSGGERRGGVSPERAELEGEDRRKMGVARIRAEYERLGTLDSMEAGKLLAQVGVNAARAYLLARPRPLESFDRMLANALVIRMARDSVYDALATADEVGVKSLAEYEFVCSALELKCFLDCDSKAYEFLRNHPLIIAGVNASGHLAGSEFCIVEKLQAMGLPLNEIKHRFDALERPDFLAQVERWIERGGAGDSSTFGGDQAMLNELGAFDQRLRLAAAERLGEEGVTRGDYLARNPWLQGEDRVRYYSNWADCDAGNALEWAGQHDREHLPRVLGRVFRNRAVVNAWYEKQTDPENIKLYLKYVEITRQTDEGR